MSTHLLDTSVLIALLDSEHDFHDTAKNWFFANARRVWLSCPITENGALRVISQPRYPTHRPVPVVAESLRTLMSFGRHERISDDVTLLGPDVDARRIRRPGQVTDTYLALLAHAHGAALATFDRRIEVAAIAHPVDIFQIPR